MAQSPRHPRARIMVVDDQPANIQVVGSFLGPLGYEIIPARDGATALQRAVNRPPDLILLDMIMPGLDGCEVLRRLRSQPETAELPVIVVSAAGDKDIVVRAFEAGAMDYVTKPFNKAELTSRVQCQLDLKVARDAWARLAEEKDKILGMLAHDLKNKLGGIQLHADMLQSRLARQEDERLRDMSHRIAEAGAQLLDFLKEFLANASTDHELKIVLSPCSLQESVQKTVRTYEEAARRKRIQLQLDLPEAPVPVLADPEALGQVLDNLVSNALKFSPPDRSVQLRVLEEAETAQCQVSDQGPGFTEKDHERLFQRYARLSAKPTGDEPSTGLGLSIVRNLVEAMGGHLDLHSKPGQGATFTVRLPRAPKS